MIRLANGKLLHRIHLLVERMYLTALAFCSTALLVSLRTHKIHQPELVLQHGTPLWALWMPAMPGSKTGLSIFVQLDCKTPPGAKLVRSQRLGNEIWTVDSSDLEASKTGDFEVLRSFLDVRHGAGGRRRWQAQANLVQL